MLYDEVFGIIIWLIQCILSTSRASFPPPARASSFPSINAQCNPVSRRPPSIASMFLFQHAVSPNSRRGGSPRRPSYLYRYQSPRTPRTPNSRRSPMRPAKISPRRTLRCRSTSVRSYDGQPGTQPHSWPNNGPDSVPPGPPCPPMPPRSGPSWKPGPAIGGTLGSSPCAPCSECSLSPMETAGPSALLTNAWRCTQLPANDTECFPRLFSFLFLLLTR